MIHYSFEGYIIAMGIILLICTIAYRFILENQVKPSINRRILLAIYAMAVFLPLIVAIIPEPSSDAIIEIGNLEVVGEEAKGGEAKQVQYVFNIASIFRLLNWVLIAGVLVMFLYTVFAVSRLLLLIRQSQETEINGVKVYLHSSKELSSFSWCNKIFLYEDSLAGNSKDLEMLIRHEQAHLDKCHWMDLVVAQIVLIFQWFNPAVWYLRKELQRIHEYEADEVVLTSGTDEKEYQMLLIRNISGNRYSGLTDGLNNCSLKKRIIMMKKTKFKKDWLLRGIAVCGFAILGGFVIHIPTVASVLEVSTENFSETEIVATTRDSNRDYEKGTIENYPDAYLSTEKIAEYKGGEAKLMEDLAEAIQYPEEAMKEKIQGRVIVRFQINTDGSLSKIEVAHSPNPILDEAAISAVEKTSGNWIAGEVGGKPVASIFNLPVTFKLKDNSEETK